MKCNAQRDDFYEDSQKKEHHDLYSSPNTVGANKRENSNAEQAVGIRKCANAKTETKRALEKRMR